MRDETLPPQVKLVYAYLSTYCASKREAWPSRKRIATETGYDVRTVDAAIRVAVDVGLIDVVHEYVNPSGARVRRTLGETLPGEQTSNRYVLHDDTYVAGKGPGRKLTYRANVAGQSKGGVASDHPGGAVTDHPPGGETPHEIDNRSIPAPRAPQNETTHTPPGEDDCASSTPKHVLGRNFVLKEPTGYRQMTIDDAAHELPGAFMAAVAHVNLEPRWNAARELGRWVKDRCADGITHEELWRRFVAVVDSAVKDPDCEWLIQRSHCPF